MTTTHSLQHTQSLQLLDRRQTGVRDVIIDIQYGYIYCWHNLRSANEKHKTTRYRRQQAVFTTVAAATVIVGSTTNRNRCNRRVVSNSPHCGPSSSLNKFTS